MIKTKTIIEITEEHNREDLDEDFQKMSLKDLRNYCLNNISEHEKEIKAALGPQIKVLDKKEKEVKMKIELSKDEIETLRWAVSGFIADIKADPFIDIAEKDLTDLRNVENKFDVLFDNADKENED